MPQFSLTHLFTYRHIHLVIDTSTNILTHSGEKKRNIQQLNIPQGTILVSLNTTPYTLHALASKHTADLFAVRVIHVSANTKRRDRAQD